MPGLEVFRDYYLWNFTSNIRLTNKCSKLYRKSKTILISSSATFMFRGTPYIYWCSTWYLIYHDISLVETTNVCVFESKYTFNIIMIFLDSTRRWRVFGLHRCLRRKLANSGKSSNLLQSFSCVTFVLTRGNNSFF